MGDSVSAVTIAGDTSGSVTLQAPAAAGAGTLTLPSGNVTLLSNVLNPGNVSAAPLSFASGNLLTTATAGSIEYDGQGFYGTPSGALRGIIPGMQYFCINSNRSYPVGSGTNSVFGVGVTLSSGTVYVMEAEMVFSRSASAANIVSFGFGGTATVNNILYCAECIHSSSTIPLVDSSSSAAFSTTTAMTALMASANFQTVTLWLRGTVSVNAGGTFIPQQSQNTPTAFYTLQAGSFFSIYPIGASGSNISIGSWA
jgi:hypothetical protein